MEIGQTEQMTGALAGLHVLEGHVVHGFAPRVGMPDVGQHLPAARADIELMGLAAHDPHERVGPWLTS